MVTGTYCLPDLKFDIFKDFLIIYLGYNTMVAGFTSNHTYMREKQQEI